jgi:hypothetical protein
MRVKTLRALTLFLGLLFFGATNGNGTLEVIVQQIQEIGPGQWLRLMARIVALNPPAQSQSASSG